MLAVAEPRPRQMKNGRDDRDDPKVTFIVPCYRLAHLLPECVESILSQTYRDFELLIMDDCSPDPTPEVARSFHDARVSHIRNEVNLGNIGNYNKGIGMARGKYVWLISADDRLRRPYALERYVQLMEAHPEVGYVVCPGVRLENGQEGGVLQWSVRADRDTIFDGRQFALDVIQRGGIVAASSMVRKECYDKIGYFPAGMPHQGDMYLWLQWALRYDVGYFAEAMVDYRIHESSMMVSDRKTAPRTILNDQLAVLWSALHTALELDHKPVARACERSLRERYVNCVVMQMYSDRVAPAPLTLQECQEHVHKNARDDAEAVRFIASIRAGVGDQAYWRADYPQALRLYGDVLRQRFWMPSLWLKYVLLRTGKVGIRLRDRSLAMRQAIRPAKPA